MERILGLDPRDWLLVALVAIGLVLATIFVDGPWVVVVGSIATVLGIALAIGQINLARAQIAQAVTVAQATREAVLVTRNKLARNELIDAIGDLQAFDRQLFDAVQTAGDPADVATRLADWRDRAFDVVALIDDFKSAPTGLRDTLIQTAKAAGEMRDNLPIEPTEIKTMTKQIRSEISSACGLLASAKIKLKLDTGELP